MESNFSNLRIEQWQTVCILYGVTDTLPVYYLLLLFVGTRYTSMILKKIWIYETNTTLQWKTKPSESDCMVVCSARLVRMFVALSYKGDILQPFVTNLKNFAYKLCCVFFVKYCY